MAEHTKLAKEIAKSMESAPHLTAQDLATEHGVSTGLVAQVLDSYRPDGTEVGAGKGGGWVPGVDDEAA